jgi:hypothetical protein
MTESRISTTGPKLYGIKRQEKRGQVLRKKRKVQLSSYDMMALYQQSSSKNPLKSESPATRSKITSKQIASKQINVVRATEMFSNLA